MLDHYPKFGGTKAATNRWRMDDERSNSSFSWSRLVIATGSILGAAFGLWLGWDFYFEGFSVGPPPPPTMEIIRRSVFLDTCVRALLVAMSAGAGFIATCLLVWLIEGINVARAGGWRLLLLKIY